MYVDWNKTNILIFNGPLADLLHLKNYSLCDTIFFLVNNVCYILELLKKLQEIQELSKPKYTKEQENIVNK